MKKETNIAILLLLFVFLLCGCWENKPVDTISEGMITQDTVPLVNTEDAQLEATNDTERQPVSESENDALEETIQSIVTEAIEVTENTEATATTAATEETVAQAETTAHPETETQQTVPPSQGENETPLPPARG